MSIASTRTVSSSTSASRTERSYAAGNRKSQFVENIDTNNNVLVRDEPDNQSSHKNFSKDQDNNQNKKDITPSTAYVNNSIEALAVSGVFDNEDTTPANKNVNVYNNNQSIIRDEELERTGRNYLKHFYEKNEHLIDVDELI